MALALARCSLSLPHGCTGTRLSSCAAAAPKAAVAAGARGGWTACVAGAATARAGLTAV
jgi:hypothetical protein